MTSIFASFFTHSLFFTLIYPVFYPYFCLEIHSLQFILIDSTAPLRVRYSTWHACGTPLFELLLFRSFVGISQIYPILIFCLFGPAQVKSHNASFMVPSAFILTQSSAPFSSLTIPGIMPETFWANKDFKNDVWSFKLFLFYHSVR